MLLITVNLQGQIGGCVSQKDLVVSTIFVPKFSPSGRSLGTEAITREILFTKREETKCHKLIRITESVYEDWLRTCPSWEKEGHWKRMSNNQKIRSYVNGLDEGYGVTFQAID